LAGANGRSTSTVAAVAAAAQELHTVAQLDRRSGCGRACRMCASRAAGSLENWEACGMRQQVREQGWC
jgi:bacterioferritin-associated ferredoxin